MHPVNFVVALMSLCGTMSLHRSIRSLSLNSQCFLYHRVLSDLLNSW